jgi:energy-converting hydrogenase Eha subunit F
VLVLEVIIFVFLSLPTPKGWKAKITNFLNNNKSIKNIMKVHLGLCLIAGLFLFDCYNQGSKFKKDKKALKKKDSMASGKNLLM